MRVLLLVGKGNGRADAVRFKRGFHNAHDTHDLTVGYQLRFDAVDCLYYVAIEIVNVGVGLWDIVFADGLFGAGCHGFGQTCRRDHGGHFALFHAGTADHVRVRGVGGDGGRAVCTAHIEAGQRNKVAGSHLNASGYAVFKIKIQMEIARKQK